MPVSTYANPELEDMHDGGVQTSRSRTPLPAGQIATLLLLRFCESASVFVIFPFLNEVRSVALIISQRPIDWFFFPAYHFSHRRKRRESRVLCWVDGKHAPSSNPSSKFFGSESKMAQDSVAQIISLVTVMYWSRLSDIIGRKPILLLGTAALAVSMVSFGLSKTFWGLVVSRCIFRALNSNAGASCLHVIRNYPNEIVYLGVIKSVVGEITDSSNSADAFALLHVPWSVGSSFG